MRNGVIKKVASIPSNAFNIEVQSAINEGRLTLTEGSKMKLNSDPFPINMVEFENKKMLIRSDQTVSAGEINIVDDSASPRMIKQKNLEIAVWKFNGGRRQTKRTKPTVNMLLKKIHLTQDQ